MKSAENDPEATIRSLKFLGLSLVAGFIVFFGGWAGTIELAGAVIAPGVIVVQSNVKKVQHPSGGVLKQILVREGDKVEQDQIIMELDDTVSRATLGVVQSQLNEFMSRAARLSAERDHADSVEFPDELLDRRSEKALASAMAGEEKLFESRRNGRTSQLNQLRERIEQIKEEIQGVEAQIDAKGKEIDFITEELVGVELLYQQNLVTTSRVMALRRDRARLEGERGLHIAEIARARGKISETELQILQVEHDFRTEVLKDLRDAQGKIAELLERRIAAEDDLKRVDIRAPVPGVVHQLTVHTVGGVIVRGETIAEIVPWSDELIVESHVAASDIDQLKVGATVRVQIMAGNRRTMPEVAGELIFVSADLSREAQPPSPYSAGQFAGGQAAGTQSGNHYLVRIALDPEQVRRLDDLTLLPGMPAEAFISTQGRTPMQYLLKPLREQLARTFRER